MKKVLALIGFIFSLAIVNAQNVPKKSYNIITKDASIEISEVDNILSRMMVDLYRSQWVDNELTIEMNDGKSITLILVSANRLSEEGIQFDEGLVRKGAMMSGGEAVKESRKFNWKVNEKNEIKDVTEY